MSAMNQAELDAAFEAYGGGVLTVLDAQSAPHPRMPATWTTILQSTEPQERIESALSLWNPGFLNMVPRFVAAFCRSLLDVRVVSVPGDDDPILAYVCGKDDASEKAIWEGRNPASFGDTEPELFDALPDEVQYFLRNVHAGFTAPDGETCGLTPPSLMTNLATWMEEPDGVRGWEGCYGWEDRDPVDPRLLLRVTGYAVYSSLCVSPDLPHGQALDYRDGEVSVEPFDKALDQLMIVPILDYADDSDLL